MRILIPLVVAVLTALPALAQEPPPIDAATIEAALAAHDAEGIATFYTEEAVVRRPGVPPIKTRTALETYFHQHATEPGFETIADLELEEVLELDGPYAYVTGTYTSLMVDQHRPVAFAALLRLEDGTWRIHRIISTVD